MICDTGIGLGGTTGATPMVSWQGKSTFNHYQNLSDKKNVGAKSSNLMGIREVEQIENGGESETFFYDEINPY